MTTKKPARGESISQEHMRNAVQTSGYLLERRVANILHKNGFKAPTNRPFLDQETGRASEYDVYAHRDIEIYGIKLCGIFPTLICECKNNSQPIVFFVKKEQTFEPFRDEVRVSGIPVKIWRRGQYVSIQDFIKVESFHHYCKPKAPVATKCCTFEWKKSSWQASDNTKQQEDLKKLIKALEFEINEDFKFMGQWFDEGETRTEFMDLSFYYPVLIYGGDIYALYIDDLIDDLTFKKCNHIQFSPEFISPYSKEVNSYHVDVITEKYLTSYLKIINEEMLAVKRRLERKKTEVFLTVGRIAEECRSLKKKPPTYRKYLEFDPYG